MPPTRPPRRPRPDEKPLSPVFVALLLAGVGVVIWALATREPPAREEDRSADLRDIGPFTAVDALGADGWVVTVDVVWAGGRDAALASSACTRVARRLGATGRQTVEIATPEGRRIVECR